MRLAGTGHALSACLPATPWGSCVGFQVPTLAWPALAHADGTSVPPTSVLFKYINTRSLVLKVQGEKAVFGGRHRPAPGGTAPLYESSHGQGVCVLLMPLSGVWNRVRGQI